MPAAPPTAARFACQQLQLDAMGMQAPAAAGRESSAPRPYIGYITSQWHTRQAQSLEQLAAISWCRSHAERMAGAALINHGGTDSDLLSARTCSSSSRPSRTSIHPALSLPRLPPRPRFSREERSTERRTGALRGKSIPELPPPEHSLAYRRPTGGGS